MTLIDPAYPSGRSFRPAKGEIETRIGPLGLNAQHLPDQAATRTYHLHVPPNVPAKQWWSVALYGLDTRCFMDTKYDKVELGSRSPVQTNADGSVDFVFAPEPPKASPESNWIPTVRGRAWFTYFRLYAPLQPISTPAGSCPTSRPPDVNAEQHSREEFFMSFHGFMKNSGALRTLSPGGWQSRL